MKYGEYIRSEECACVLCYNLQCLGFTVVQIVHMMNDDSQQYQVVRVWWVSYLLFTDSVFEFWDFLNHSR